MSHKKEYVVINAIYFTPIFQVSVSFKSLPSHCFSLKRLGSVANNSYFPRKASEF